MRSPIDLMSENILRPTNRAALQIEEATLYLERTLNTKIDTRNPDVLIDLLQFIVTLIYPSEVTCKRKEIHPPV